MTTYVEAFIQEMRETFCKWANSILETMKAQEGKENPVLVVLSPFLAMQYTNDGSYLPRHAAPKLKRLRQALKNKVKFYQAQSPDSSSDLTFFGIFGISSNRNIDYREELHVYYVSLYDFTSIWCKLKHFV